MSSPDDVKVPMASSLQQVVGALLFGADHPLSVEEIRACLKSVAEADGGSGETVKLFAEASPREVGDAVEDIAKELSRLGLGIEVTGLNGGYRFQTQACCGRWVRNLLKMDRPNSLSRPALETLAIIAYRQPIAKSEIESIRGVAVDHIVKALMELHLIRIVGRSDLPGRPFLYGTTATFLSHFGLNTLKELNELDPTLQRSKASERKAIHRKEKPKEKEKAAPGALAEILGGGPADGEAGGEPVFAEEPAEP
ncbi:MAG: SMC-Scp complex subunit ScpB [Verrucomicrobiota bacterium]|jgi:segregation and condensation protein B|nr:SMC-Scp complex subunit ScpB [Verrucomicrobiota bacterium]